MARKMEHEIYTRLTMRFIWRHCNSLDFIVSSHRSSQDYRHVKSRGYPNKLDTEALNLIGSS